MGEYMGLMSGHRIAFSMSMPYDRLGEVDFTCEFDAEPPHPRYFPSADDPADGIVASYCLIQAEAATFIIAQTFPVIRVMIQSSRSSIPSRAVSSVSEPTYSKPGNAKATSEPTPAGHESIELVVLATGRIVDAASDEGRAFKASTEAARVAAAEGEQQGADEETRRAGRRGGAGADDGVHSVWADMGLSTRAWSKSPPPGPDRLHR